MGNKLVKSLLVATFSLFALLNTVVVNAQHEEPKTEETGDKPHAEAKFNPGKIIMEHISDSHDFHFFDYGGKPYALPLPVIIYTPAKGLNVFMSSKLDHGHTAYNGYQLVNEHYLQTLKEKGIDIKGISEGKIIAVDADGKPDAAIKVYDFSMTRNVVQMIFALILLVVIMTRVAKKYKVNGIKKAPSGFQNAVEPVITLIRDEVGKPNLGHKYESFMPLLLTIFFFILINNIIGLIPGTANVTGNIAFTAVLAIVSFVVMMLKTNRHFWSHIFWPKVPHAIKFILVPVEFLGIFTKPFALMIRLFANMVAGHIVITCFIMLIFIFAGMSKVAGIGFAPLSILFTVFIYFIEILVVFIQAFIFTNLTAVFIGQSMEGDHGHEEVKHA